MKNEFECKWAEPLHRLAICGLLGLVMSCGEKTNKVKVEIQPEVASAKTLADSPELIKAIQTGLDYHFGNIEIPYGRFDYGARQTVPEDKMVNRLDALQSMGFIKYELWDKERQREKANNRLLIVFGNKYDVWITDLTNSRLLKHRTTESEVYFPTGAFAVTKITNYADFTSAGLPVGENHLLVLGVAFFKPNDVFANVRLWGVDEFKFRCVVHVNQFTGGYSVVGADIGDPASVEWYSDNIGNLNFSAMRTGPSSHPPPQPYRATEPAVSHVAPLNDVNTGSSAPPFQPGETSAVVADGENPQEKVFNSPCGRYSVTHGPTPRWGTVLMLKSENEFLTNQPADGVIKAVHWSPGGHYVAVDIAQRIPDDIVWIIKLADGEVIKEPSFGISRAMMEPAAEEIRKAAASQWGNLEQKNRQRAQHYSCNSVGWESDHVLRMNFTGYYGESDQPADPPPQITIDGFFDYSKGSEDVRFSPATGAELKEDAISGSWSEINSSQLHANQLFSVDRDRHNVSFALFWMERFGANQFVAHVNDLDWSKARIVEDIQGGGFAGATSISIPMREGRSHEALIWNPDAGYSSEAPPWNEQVPPVSRKQSNEEIGIFAADRKSAEALVTLFRKFRDMPESCRDKVSFEPDAILTGERYPQTRKALIREEDFAHLGSEDLRYAINELFARHGAYFGNKDVLAMFEGFEWYRPMITMTFDRIEADFFSEHERENLKILGRLRERKR